ncbi:hypothetical protein [Halomontanus rarus]|nr:hypothetical protein [Halovivax sp. TS33]
MGREDDELDNGEENGKIILEEASQADVENAIEDVEDRDEIRIGS